MNIKRLLSVSILLAVNSTLYAQTDLDKTAQQIAAEMIPGWNLGNTLEANRDFAITEGMSSHLVSAPCASPAHGYGDISVIPKTIPSMRRGCNVYAR